MLPQRSGGGSFVSNPATSTIFANGQIVASKTLSGTSASSLIPSTSVITTRITGILDSQAIFQTSTYAYNGFFVSYGGHFSRLTFNSNPNIAPTAPTTYGPTLNYTGLDGRPRSDLKMIMCVDGGALYTLASPYTSAPTAIAGTSPYNWIGVSCDTNVDNNFVAITSNAIMFCSVDNGVTFTQNSSAPTGVTYVAVDMYNNQVALLTTTNIFTGTIALGMTAFGNAPTLASGVTFVSFVGLMSGQQTAYTNYVVATSTGVLYWVRSPGASAVWTLMTALANDGTLVSGTLLKQYKLFSDTAGMIVGTPNGKVYVLQNSTLSLTRNNQRNDYDVSPYPFFTDTTGQYWLAIQSLNKPWTALGIGGLNPTFPGGLYGIHRPCTTKIYAGSTNDAVYTGNSGANNGSTNGNNGADTIDTDMLNIRTSTIYRMVPPSGYPRNMSLMPFQVFGRATGSTATTGNVAVDFTTAGATWTQFNFSDPQQFVVTAIAQTATSANAPSLATITFSSLQTGPFGFTLYWAGNTAGLPFFIHWTATGW